MNDLLSLSLCFSLPHFNKVNVSFKQGISRIQLMCLNLLKTFWKHLKTTLKKKKKKELPVVTVTSTVLFFHVDIVLMYLSFAYLFPCLYGK